MACSTCGGGNMAPLIQARTALMNDNEAMQNIETEAQEPANPHDVRFEFIGPQVGHVTYSQNPSGREYIAGNNSQNKYIDVDSRDVAKFDAMSNFKRVTPKAAQAQRKAVPRPRSEHEKQLEAQANAQAAAAAAVAHQKDALTEEMEAAQAQQNKKNKGQ